MVRKVMDNSQVLHVWAAQTQDEARTPNGNLSFSGGVLSSYSTPIAHITSAPDGSGVALITCISYSVTTSGKHMPSTRDTSQYPTFHVPYLLLPPGHMRGRYAEPRDKPARDWRNDESGEDYAARCAVVEHAGNVAHYLAQYRAGMTAAMRKRELPGWAEVNALRWVNGAQEMVAELPAEPGSHSDYGQPGRALHELRRYCAVFNLPLPADMPDAQADMVALRAHHAARAAKRDTPAYRAKVARDAARRAAVEAEREAKRAEALTLARAENADKLAAWKRGVPVHLPWEVSQTATGGGVVRVVGDVVETARGAKVPLAAGRRLLGMCAHVRRTGHEWTGSLRVGSFHLSHVSADGTARVGCHLLEWASMVEAATNAGIPIPDGAEAVAMGEA
jgi:hypothetical protein